MLEDGWHLDEKAAAKVGVGPTFFRLIRNGVQRRAHGWAQGDTITQWGSRCD